MGLRSRAALKKLNSSVTLLGNGASLNDDSFHKGLAETVGATAAAITAFELTGSKNATVAEGLKRLEDTVGVLQKNFSKAAAREKQGGMLTAKEKQKLEAIKEKQAVLEKRLKAIHTGHQTNVGFVPKESGNCLSELLEAAVQSGDFDPKEPEKHAEQPKLKSLVLCKFFPRKWYNISDENYVARNAHAHDLKTPSESHWQIVEIDRKTSSLLEIFLDAYQSRSKFGTLSSIANTNSPAVVQYLVHKLEERARKKDNTFTHHLKECFRIALVTVKCHFSKGVRLSK
ncbi:hypothetical protein LP7551_04720 [Roseibium album]|nr:hypothetical protein LP7551_04720 [Roseibium album]